MNTLAKNSNKLGQAQFRARISSKIEFALHYDIMHGKALFQNYSYSRFREILQKAKLGKNFWGAIRHPHHPQICFTSLIRR